MYHSRTLGIAINNAMNADLEKLRMKADAVNHVDAMGNRQLGKRNGAEEVPYRQQGAIDRKSIKEDENLYLLASILKR